MFRGGEGRIQTFVKSKFSKKLNDLFIIVYLKIYKNKIQL